MMTNRTLAVAHSLQRAAESLLETKKELIDSLQADPVLAKGAVPWQPISDHPKGQGYIVVIKPGHAAKPYYFWTSGNVTLIATVSHPQEPFTNLEPQGHTFWAYLKDLPYPAIETESEGEDG